jgi:hypothetical protein
MLKNVKKKDCLTFYILENDKTKLYINIQPTGQNVSGPAARSETMHLAIQIIDKYIELDLPDFYLDDNDNKHEAYGPPMIIGANDFQKIKKMSSVCKSNITVTLQRSSYVSFRAGDAAVLGSLLEFGELTMTPEEYDDDIPKKKGKKDIKTVGNIYPHVYEAEFSMALFAPLTKLPGLCGALEIYAPKKPEFPLKISCSANSGLGEIQIYIKSTVQIAAMEQQIKK